MSNTSHYSLQLVPSTTSMTVREFREAIAGKNGNFAKLDNFLAAADIVSCEAEEIVGGYRKLVFTKKNGDVMDVQLPPDSNKADVTTVPNAASVSGNVLQMIREDIGEDGSVIREVLFSVVLPFGSESAQPFSQYTPEKGVDYFTDADKQELLEELKMMLPTESWTFVMEDGSTIVKEVFVK